MEGGQVQQVPLHQQLTKISPKQLSEPGPSVLSVRQIMYLGLFRLCSLCSTIVV